MRGSAPNTTKRKKIYQLFYKNNDNSKVGRAVNTKSNFVFNMVPPCFQ